jgi:galactose oxidase-like protein
MAGSWTTFNAPDTSSGLFNADIMLLLTDGSVLVHNGYTSVLANANQWLRLTPDQNGRYETGTWSGELNMQYARQWFASGILRDGRLFAIGGEYSTDPAAPSDAWSGEIFDPEANTWTAIGKPAAFDWVRGDCNGSVLGDGRVLLGGASVTVPPSTWSRRTAIWDPHHDSWVEAGLEFGAVSTTTKKDPFEEETFNLLPDGSVLAPAVRDTPKAQRYLPWLDRWVHCSPSPVKLAVGSVNGTLEEETGPTILLPDGRAFAIGGSGLTSLYTLPPASSPAGPGSWTKGPSFPADTSASPNWPTLTALDAPACLLPHGRVVCMGGTTVPDGSEYYPVNPVLLEFDPGSAATTLPQLDVQPPLPAGKFTWQCFFLLLPTGQLLLSAQDHTLFLYTPDPATSAPDPAWKPAHVAVDHELTLGRSYTVRGTQINGLSQAVCYGDDGGMATNYPIVRLTHRATGQVVYVRSHDFSTMKVATGTAVPHDLHSCRIDIPSYLATGHWNLEVIANGIPSDPVAVHIDEPYDHDHDHQFVGKIERLIYDRFGDFEAFALESAGGQVRRFESHEPRLAELVTRAWLEHWRVGVNVDGDSRRPVSISLLD